MNYETIRETTEFILGEYNSFSPRVGIILGTGLGSLAERVENGICLPYNEIPHFPISTVESHKGILHLGEISQTSVCVMQGRFHYYEGYKLSEVTFPVRVMRELGCSSLIVMSSVGSVNPSLQAGDIALISDHINLFGDNPLIGHNDDRLGVRFPDMSEAYDRQLMSLAQEAALECKLELKRGVYLGWGGPSLETAAEYQMIHRLGADMVGMSTVPEVIVANHGGMKVLGIATVSNYCDYCNLKSCTLEQIVKTSKSVQAQMEGLMPAVLARL